VRSFKTFESPKLTLPMPLSRSFVSKDFQNVRRVDSVGDILRSMGSRLDQLRAQRETIIEIVSRNKACNVAVFGSVARGDDTLESDVDLLVDFLPGASLTDQFRLQEELATLLETPVDVISRRALKPRDTAIREEALAL